MRSAFEFVMWVGQSCPYAPVLLLPLRERATTLDGRDNYGTSAQYEVQPGTSALILEFWPAGSLEVQSKSTFEPLFLTLI
jgi:hypothetical protein